MHVATLITSLTSIGTSNYQVQLPTLLTCDVYFPAYLLNLRGSDIPFNPLFQSYLFVGLESAILFVDNAKVKEEVGGYLKELGVDLKEYNDLWAFLRRREWGEGKV